MYLELAEAAEREKGGEGGGERRESETERSARATGRIGRNLSHSSLDIAQIAESPSATEANGWIMTELERERKGQRTPKMSNRDARRQGSPEDVNRDLPPSLSIIELLEENAPEVERLRMEKKKSEVSSRSRRRRRPFRHSRRGCREQCDDEDDVRIVEDSQRR